jgi:arginyl-tRNA synthetase
MTPSVLDQLNDALAALVDSMAAAGGVDSPAASAYAWASPRNPEHGDFSTNAGLLLGKPLRRNPFDLATELAARLLEHPDIEQAEAARPGFVNIRLSNAAVARMINAVRTAGADYGRTNVGGGRSLLLEFVSANPTGPMHIGHLRHAVLGEAIGRLLDAGGWRVTREFYINDGGNQIATLGATFAARLRQAQGEQVELGENMYPGEYLLDYARQLLAERGPDGVAAMTDDERTLYAKEQCLALVKEHLGVLDVHFDRFVSEAALYASGAVDETLAALKTSGRTYEQDGALWLRTTDLGDDKDRVLVKSDGSLTYLVPDLAYHHDKYKRGLDGYLNIFGADHAGYPPRLRAGLTALGHQASTLEVVLLRLVFLVRAGERLDMGKRSGNVVNAIDLINEVGADVARYFLLERSASSEINFDLDLAKDQSDRNPVFKIQYAHARICSLLNKAAAEGFQPAEPGDDSIGAHLNTVYERALVLHLLRLPEIVGRCAAAREPHHLPAWLLEAADLWNRYWSARRSDAEFRAIATIIDPAAPERTRARLALAVAVRQSIANALRLLAISAPERLDRADAEPDAE